MIGGLADEALVGFSLSGATRNQQPSNNDLVMAA